MPLMDKTERVVMPMQPLERARWVIQIEQEELAKLASRLGNDFLQALRLAAETLDRGGKIVVLGVGKSAHIGAKLAATLTSTGSRAVVLDSLHALHGDLGIVSDGDLVLALSYSGETEELTAILPALKRFSIKIIAMTGRSSSTLAQWSDVALDTSVSREACPLGLAPTSSTTAMLALGDALAMVLLEQRGFKHEDFAKFHPSGRLGRRLLLKVCDVARPPSSAPVLALKATVLDAVREMTNKRCGAAVITDNDGLVLGIFTQGDFTRCYQEDSLVGTRLLEDVMTRNPITIHADAPAVEILSIIERRRVDDLIAVDSEGRFRGLVDSQDLARHQLV